MHKNAEGYSDPTAGQAVESASRLPKHVAQVISAIKLVAGLAGFEIANRIVLRDRETGKEW